MASLESPDNDWTSLFMGLHYSAGVSVSRSNSAVEKFEYYFDQLALNRWRLDVKRNGAGSLVQDGDFWFSAEQGSPVGRYDRLGFDDRTIESISGSLQSQNTLLASATHLLDIPLRQFVQLEEVEWESRVSAVHPESSHRLNWKLVPKGEGSLRPAFGAIEWTISEQQLGLLTHSEYYFGTRSEADPKGVVVDVYYDRHDGRLLPTRAVRLESGVRTETLRGAVAAANPDPAYYTPEALGLERPSKPWESYQIWLLLGMIALGIAIGVRWWRMRTISDFNTNPLSR